MVLCTTFIELIPFIGTQVLFMLTGILLQQYIGSYAFTASTINITLSAGIYYNAFKKCDVKNVTKITELSKTQVNQ
uniref:Uncharacterized protein n=1 Tax=Panagrolaimus sp. ES5 TaxID=591445 RepID=A0AC34GB52_9BILA